VQFNDLGLQPSGPLEITDGNSTIEIQDVITGEVWLCSGQSNMEWNLADSEHGEQALAQADTENIRLLNVPNASSENPQVDQPEVWHLASRESAKSFSAVGFFFGRMRSQSGRPIGLIGANYGASIAEAWIPNEELEGHPVLRDWLKQHKQLREESRRTHQSWCAAAEARGEWCLTDKGVLEEAKKYSEPDFDDADWATAKIGVRWSQFDPPISMNGAIWFRTEIEISEPIEEAALHLGIIENYDSVYVNGKLVGETSAERSEQVFRPRVYQVPADVLKAGRNSIAVRIFAHIEDGGFVSPSDQIFLQVSASTRVSLGDNWRFKVEFAVPTLGWPIWACLEQSRPSGLWNSMISPLIPFSLTGALWYQGESNADRASTHLEALEVLIRAWRKAFEVEDLPFLIVQLANYGLHHDSPSESNWTELREAQWLAREIEFTETVVTIDVGDSGDIHPRKKLPVAERLNLAATSLETGNVAGHISPHMLSYKVTEEGIEIELSEPVFTPNGEPAVGLAIRGEQSQWHWADAKVVGSTLHVSASEVKHPRAVRYAWDEDPKVNLCSANGLPLAPFRTDHSGRKKVGAV
jgi:sialate O-acetylesterase